jgi:hypothetical protein
MLMVALFLVRDDRTIAFATVEPLSEWPTLNPRGAAEKDPCPEHGTGV